MNKYVFHTGDLKERMIRFSSMLVDVDNVIEESGTKFKVQHVVPDSHSSMNHTIICYKLGLLQNM